MNASTSHRLKRLQEQGAAYDSASRQAPVPHDAELLDQPYHDRRDPAADFNNQHSRTAEMMELTWSGARCGPIGRLNTSSAIREAMGNASDASPT